MTITQQILATHAGRDFVEPGELIEAKIDLALGNDVTTPVAIDAFEQAGFSTVFDPEKIAIVLDHFTPNKDIRSAELSARCRAFAKQYHITHFYDVGCMGIEHALLPEQGLVVPGACIVGADSHTCTYGALGAFSTGVGSTDLAGAMYAGKAWFKVPDVLAFELVGTPGKWISGKDVILHLIGEIGVDGALYRSMEFFGEGVSKLSIDDRFTIANMAIEAGAKNAMFPVDDVTRSYLAGRIAPDYPVYDAWYPSARRIDLGKIRPTVALPHLPSNARPVDEVKGIQIDQVVIGSCTNGRISDLRVAAQVLRGKRVAKGVRVIVIPATQEIYLQMVREGLCEVFVEAGAAVSTPTCGPCLGGHMGILAAGERAVATTNRNFVGRMGHPTSEVYLASPAVAAAAAVAGELISPEEVCGR